MSVQKSKKMKMVKFGIFWVFCLGLVGFVSSGVQKEFRKFSEQLKCQAKSPLSGMKYGFEYQTNVLSPVACFRESKRTCCDKNNLFAVLKE